ncbi:uncharacterized protein FFUJ_10048 [Fusarium fujikuroi IMI 58289]|uniref:Uncharacterized protein n=2 Tax=Fusarium fujikuroi TaxID=5127 RepID=S0EES6_GIBF5|nr:uncharacterized protein FFUJ_10048 [Fusarium fujikuroi IMI 58289]KLO80903.1 uncharacterized protein LW93_9150 [Fusarium fujikuroi]KLP15367.1 uncharacterized protein LW94_13445 [Fusarium fujikuroi]QGI68797.1 hypothetical protein CEK27_012768 [Fusarium fujikuroi]QGI85984.1 hypothetical protein CEK25_012713 [Fusarium fujikuroi]QGI86165.1 hypothetical protein CEK25_012894 [Fusarium fujikuroi]
MVRTKTGPRTLEERYPKDKYPSGPPQISLPPRLPLVSNNRIFNDHTGRPALMSWESSGVCPLPPLASWVFYMVHPDVPRDFDGCIFQNGLEDGEPQVRGGRFRWEFFFLPGATTEECHEHYRGELKARGTIWRHIRKVKRAMKLEKQKSHQPVEDDPVEESVSGLGSTKPESSSDEEATANNQQLPGLVWPKHDRDCSFVMYRGWFFVYPHANIDCRGADGAAREIDIVRFDPIDQEDEWGEDEVRTFDPMEHPIHVTRKKAREDYEQGVKEWMYRRICSHWERSADEATDDALKLGWQSW